MSAPPNGRGNEGRGSRHRPPHHSHPQGAGHRGPVTAARLRGADRPRELCPPSRGPGMLESDARPPSRGPPREGRSTGPDGRPPEGGTGEGRRGPTRVGCPPRASQLSGRPRARATSVRSSLRGCAETAPAGGLRSSRGGLYASPRGRNSSDSRILFSRS